MVEEISYKPIVTIVGRPNVGKSTLFNRISGKRTAITSEEPGTTRDRLYDAVTWNKKEFILVDTAGIETELEDELAEDIRMQIDVALDEADYFVFAVDAQTGITPQDEAAAEKLRKLNKPCILIVNKVDNPEIEKELSEFYSLGLGEPYPVSAIHGRGIGDFLDKLIKDLKSIAGKKIEIPDADISIALVGRPNVGKSSIINQISGQKRAIVSDIPGTTRDINIIYDQIDDLKTKIIDTAGIRRRGKIGTGIEKFSVLRAFKAVDSSDTTLLILDATEGVVAQDLHIAGFTKDLGKGLIIIVNKWDLIEKDEKTMDKYLAMLRSKFDFVYFAPVIFASALTGKNIDKIGPLVKHIFDEQNKKISTSKINSLIEKLILKRPPGMKRGIRPKLFYTTQTGVKPPTFTIFSNHPEMIHFSYMRYLENNFRAEFGFDGTPIKFILKERA
ncbi:TPA: ribosome biogenesis GTPase Der [candidate division CPR2 bacterium]|uniref:GTPase Der n=1 Tax=candidate division CPR2 bacterium GW2011_GWC1_41_48 TaxID=1618344 RepID=A0A0G0WA36_UNCC2|nr:MAG: GTPase Der [candidate division CPR2 bacterium GW2011_GWC2_39_35]KKR28009.1 MAG: GTPase Der [candidate division CPR2 bacterium GW2011_GWD2_39_7]KKR28413.1 MAG: GTPase Der [candidate division CPR2 bacterium GW2011_GWD1_39_7]KKS09840.1 MAG: GTPase Der [candidate division CPR2 bacterium GW2011_GWC1_41_48]OGB60673.1 MAG: ribosome biogenesis GTPase Der [candidate division CPR2 bacterium GWD1_39_7]OGB72103.1 MAG: ribosome biogenesis GTPase Der [candidate division CPR2 bacterium GWD2_39_7]HBG